jgi:serine/threonine-protein kinase RsbT
MCSLDLETRVFVNSDTDVVLAREKGRALAATLEFSASEATLIATAISELARHIVLHAGQGEILIKRLEHGKRTGVSVEARGQGPGSSDLDDAVPAGCSASSRLGLGLPGVRRVMDDFEIASEVGKGTRVTVRKWTRRNPLAYGPPKTAEDRILSSAR